MSSASATATSLQPYSPSPPTKVDLNWATLSALDLSLLSQPGGKETLAKQVLSFNNQHGFFYVTNHGLTPTQINRQYSIAKSFFSLPLEEKLKYISNTASGDFRGLKPQSTGKLGVRDNVERYNIPKFTKEHERRIPQSYWTTTTRSGNLETLVNLHRYEEPGLEYLRYMVYHPRSEKEDSEAGNLWANGHTDYNTLTFLFHQPIAGLQVLSPDGEWRYVRSDPDQIIANIADALVYLSGGFLKSTVHRVVRPPVDQIGQDRFSLIYFARPGARVLMRPLESPLVQRLGISLDKGHVKALEGVTAEEWARARIAKDHRFRTGIVDSPEKEIVAGVPQKYYD
ncbi:hypothetical protein BDV09DRAFT_196951 [Aspergillus tetrazonus]